MDSFITIVVLVLVAAIIWAIAKAANSDRYANMTEEEFEAEARRSSAIGGAVAGLQKVIDPSHRVEYVQGQNERIEVDGAESSDHPDSGDASDPKQ